jgi:hypothetical protein
LPKAKSLADFQQLSDSEVDSIQLWNMGAGTGDIAIAIQKRIAEETEVFLRSGLAFGNKDETNRDVWLKQAAHAS